MILRDQLEYESDCAMMDMLIHIHYNEYITQIHEQSFRARSNPVPLISPGKEEDPKPKILNSTSFLPHLTHRDPSDSSPK